MVSVAFPVKKHVAKYLESRFGNDYTLSSRSFLGLLLLKLLNGKVERSDYDVPDSIFRVNIPEYYFNNRKFSIDKEKSKYVGVLLERMFVEDFHLFVDRQLVNGKDALNSVYLFCELNNITDDDIKLCSLYRSYQRYSKENITQKRKIYTNKIHHFAM